MGGGIQEQLLVAVLVAEQQDAEDEGVHRAPAEPVEGPQQQLGVHLGLELLVEVGLKGDVDEVEEVQVPDPDDAEGDVPPAQEDAYE